MSESLKLIWEQSPPPTWLHDVGLAVLSGLIGVFAAWFGAREGAKTTREATKAASDAQRKVELDASAFQLNYTLSRMYSTQITLLKAVNRAKEQQRTKGGNLSAHLRPSANLLTPAHIDPRAMADARIIGGEKLVNAVALSDDKHNSAVDSLATYNALYRELRDRAEEATMVSNPGPHRAILGLRETELDDLGEQILENIAMNVAELLAAITELNSCRADYFKESIRYKLKDAFGNETSFQFPEPMVPAGPAGPSI